VHVGNAVREQIHVGSCKARKPDEGYEDENTTMTFRLDSVLSPVTA